MSGRIRYTAAFKRGAVAQLTDRGHSVTSVAERCPSSTSPSMLFLSSRFSSVSSATYSFSSRASDRSPLTSVELAWRVVSSASRFLP